MTAAASFQVALTGLRDGHAAEDVAPRLAQLFTQPQEKMLGILDGKHRVLKNGLSEADARKYAAALLHAGCTCTITPRQTVAAQRGRPDVAAAATAVLAAKSEAYRERQLKLSRLELASGQRLAIDCGIAHGVYLLAIKHLALVPAAIAWLPVVAIMLVTLQRLCRGLGYQARQRKRLNVLMFIPAAGLLTLAILSNRAGRQLEES